MTLSSMTGFARTEGVSGSYAWSWELRSVNAKGLDLRIRLPSGWDGLEPDLRSRAAGRLSRGTVQATLSVRRDGASQVVRINAAVLDAVLAAGREIGTQIEVAPPRLDGLLAVRGVVDLIEAEEDEAERSAAQASASTGFSEALDALDGMRRHEGQALARVLEQRLAEIEHLTRSAEAAPGRSAEAVRRRIAEQVRELIGTSERLEPDRLHQEAVLIAMRADIREELDRLLAHVGQARELLTGGGAVGRRLDFLSQEFNREANTLCAKSNDVELTNLGMALKNAVEQFREQVQNLE